MKTKTGVYNLIKYLLTALIGVIIAINSSFAAVNGTAASQSTGQVGIRLEIPHAMFTKVKTIINDTFIQNCAMNTEYPITPNTPYSALSPNMLSLNCAKVEGYKLSYHNTSGLLIELTL